MAESETLFDRETILDLTVNFIPLGILLVFIVLYLVFTPFGFSSVITSIQFAIIGVMFVALAILTYYSGAAISRSEKEQEARQAEAEAAAADLEEGAAEAELEADAADEAGAEDAVDEE